MDHAAIAIEEHLEHQPASLAALRALDLRIQQWRQQGTIFPNPQQITHEQPGPLGSLDVDVIIAGGTLGVILGAALVRQNWRVALVERGQLQGREQEWNISRRELHALLDLDLITEAQLADAIAVEFNPNRIQFDGGDPLWVTDILNLGVSPRIILEQLKGAFLEQGGLLLEGNTLTAVKLHPDGVAVELSAQNQGDRTLKGKLLIDAMGHFSPLVAQARANQSPDGVCMVVGTCAKGLPAVETGDLMVSMTPIQQDCQYFWEAFPAASGRTTYLFTYADLHPDRPSLEQLLTDYFRLLPSYQNCDLADLSIQRMLFGVFPSYRQSPLHFDLPRVLAIGDSSGQQSPLSFGGFGAMLRHLKRLTHGIDEALHADALNAPDLRLLQPYQPNLSATWMFQRAMSPQVGQALEPNHINRLLNEVFRTMTQLGDEVLEPFLQDVVQFKGLTLTLGRMTLTAPGLIPQILRQVGPVSLMQWLPHYLALGGYSAFTSLNNPIQDWTNRLTNGERYRWRRRLDAWAYGAGLDPLGADVSKKYPLNLN